MCLCGISIAYKICVTCIGLEQVLFPRTSASSAKRCTEAGARRVAPRPDQPYQADSDGSGYDMVWLDLSARY